MTLGTGFVYSHGIGEQMLGYGVEFWVYGLCPGDDGTWDLVEGDKYLSLLNKGEC